MSIFERATSETTPPIVEHRLHLALSALDCLQRLAYFADESHRTRFVAHPRGFTRIVRHFRLATEVRLNAVIAVLTPRCTDVDRSNGWTPPTR